MTIVQAKEAMNTAKSDIELIVRNLERETGMHLNLFRGSSSKEHSVDAELVLKGE